MVETKGLDYVDAEKAKYQGAFISSIVAIQEADMFPTLAKQQAEQGLADSGAY